MLDVCLLGTGGMMPLPRRWLTSMMCRYNGKTILVDCGEGTQIAIKQKGWPVKPIDVICITHFHADHISGLPGLLLAMANADRKEPITMIGPRGLEKVVKSLMIITPSVPFDIEFIEIKNDKQTFEFEDFRIKSFAVDHGMVCYGYTVEIDRAGKFDADEAEALGIPMQEWGVLQSGENVVFAGETYTPDMVMGPERKGLKVTYATDTRPTDSIVEAATDADLFICEGMYGEDDRDDKAEEYKHMTFSEAAEIAKKAQPKEMWLTHYSPLLLRPKDFIEKVQEVFPNARYGSDGMEKSLKFSE